MRKFYSVILATLTAFMLSFTATASAQSVDQILANPKVDDIIAGRLDYFSEFSFGDDEEVVYGLLRVIEVNANEIVVITADSAWLKPASAEKELKGDLSDVGWDFEEEIIISRSELASLKREGLIINARRLSAREITQMLD